jgi:hypothetical protein
MSMAVMTREHVPVLLGEVVEALAVRRGGRYVDNTLGGAARPGNPGRLRRTAAPGHRPDPDLAVARAAGAYGGCVTS